MSIGKRSAMSYENPHGKKVTIRFRGLGNLDVIYDPLAGTMQTKNREWTPMDANGDDSPQTQSQEIKAWKGERRTGPTPGSSAPLIRVHWRSFAV